MFEAQDEVARRLHIVPSTRVLDVGGAGAKFEFGDVTIVDIQEPNWTTDQYIRLDICREPLPFADNTFDVCICTQTLEDLPYPFVMLDEMRRVARAGYIETPHRGLESSFQVSPHLGTFPGWGHHRWMFEAENLTTIKVVPKFWQLLRHGAEVVAQWRGPRAFSFYWNDHYEFFNAETIDREGHGWDRLLDDHNGFVERHRHLISSADEILRGASVGASHAAPNQPSQGQFRRVAAR